MLQLSFQWNPNFDVAGFGLWIEAFAVALEHVGHFGIDLDWCVSGRRKPVVPNGVNGL
jgi:hypothetical protein